MRSLRAVQGGWGQGWEAEDRAAEGGVSCWRSQGIYLQTLESLAEPLAQPLSPYTYLVGGFGLAEPMAYLSVTRLRHPGEPSHVATQSVSHHLSTRTRQEGNPGGWRSSSP